jgi:hypothetical protein
MEDQRQTTDQLEAEVANKLKSREKAQMEA